jgi:hypothetical protein
MKSATCETSDNFGSYAAETCRPSAGSVSGVECARQAAETDLQRRDAARCRL